jgi:hypothetical protein
MFSNFPGLLVAKGSGRQNNNIFRVPPGGAAEIETAGMPIQQVAMGMPYKGPDAVFVQFVEALNQEGQRLGGTAEVMVGEGRQDAPVGTTLALIEQAIKPILATHKRLVQGQSEELQLLVERFREDPQAWIRASQISKPLKTTGKAYPSGLTWDDEMFLTAINQNLIVPRADPNTASHLQRMLRNAALYQMAKDDPPSFNLLRIRQVCIRGIGFNDPDQFINPNPQPAGPPPDPKALAAQMSAQADLIDSSTKARQLQQQIQDSAMQQNDRSQDRQTKLAIAGAGLQKERIIASQQMAHDTFQKNADRTADIVQQHMDRAHEMGTQARDQQHERQQAHFDRQQDMQQHASELAHQGAMAQQQQAHEAGQAQQQQFHEAGMAQNQQAHQTQMGQREGMQQLEQTALKAAPGAGGGQSRSRRTTQRARGGSVGDFITPFGVARRAPDGSHYIRHPRTGQYYRIQRRQ